MYLLDTDTLNLVFTGHPKVLARRASVPSSEIAIAIITRIELLRGRFDFLMKAATVAELRRAQELLDRTDSLLLTIPKVFPIDDLATTVFAGLVQNRRLKKIGRADLLIASITLAKRATLVTRNRKDFRQVPGLKLENWAD